MPGAFGPILTTGVALSAAVVVVVNPMTAPHADVRIPAAQANVAKAGGEAVDMLDEDFIEAVGPKPTGSTHPLAILKDLVGSLVADVSDLGKSAVLRAFLAGASVVSGSQVPELTAASYPYIVPHAPETLPVLPWINVPGPVPQDLRPVVEQALTAIIADSGDLTDPNVVAAAFLAGVALAAEDLPVLQNLRDLVDGGLRSAADKAASAVSLLPRTAIGDVIRDAVGSYLPALRSDTSVNVPALSERVQNSGTDLLATGAPAVGGDAVEVANRQGRPGAVDRTPSPLLGIGDVDSAVTEAVPSRHSPTTGPGAVGAAVPTAPHRSMASGIADDIRGSIGRAVKAHVERSRN